MGELHLGCWSTGCVASSASRPTSESRRSPTARPSPGRSTRSSTRTRNRRVVPGSSAGHHRRRPNPRSPTTKSGGYEFVNKVTGGRIPREYIPSVDAGAREAMDNGVLAGYPMVDVAVTLLDGQYHVSTRRSWRSRSPARWPSRRGRSPGRSGAAGADDGGRGRHPEDFMGDVIGDLECPPRPDSGHGRAQRRPGRQAVVPLSEMFGYVGDLRSKTQGRASYSMQFDSYSGCPRTSRRRSSRRLAGVRPRVGGAYRVAVTWAQPNNQVGPQPSGTEAAIIERSRRTRSGEG